MQLFCQFFSVVDNNYIYDHYRIDWQAIDYKYYRLGNIDAGYTVDDVTNHVESTGVRVISCFDRTSANAVSEDNKSFRICIINADKEKFFLRR